MRDKAIVVQTGPQGPIGTYHMRACNFMRRHQFMLVCLALAVAATSGCKKQEAARQVPPAEVTTVTVEPRDVPVTFEYVAQVQSSRQVNIQARVNGFLDKRMYTEGSIVKEGTILFVMDKKPFQVQLDQAKAMLAKQQAAYEITSKNLDRVKPLTAANALSQKDLDEAQGQFESAAAAVEQAKASVAQAELNLSYTDITSPVTGITSSAMQADGTYLSPSNSLLTTVAVISPAYVNFSLSENERLSLRDSVAKGKLILPKDMNFEAEVVLADGKVFPHTGQVTFMDPSFNSQTGTFLIRATVENPDNLLRPNQFVHLRLKGPVKPKAILVPQRAVRSSAKGQFVWVIDKDGKAQQRPVIVGDWHDNDWFIDEGLQTGEQVIVDGSLTLGPGSPVTVKSATGKGDTAGKGDKEG
jgi:membrane fusion protein, multidrug efflux system